MSKISGLSSGEFLGIVADDPNCNIELKTFHSEIVNDHEALKNKQDNYFDIPVIRKVDKYLYQKSIYK